MHGINFIRYYFSLVLLGNSMPGALTSQCTELDLDTSRNCLFYPHIYTFSCFLCCPAPAAAAFGLIWAYISIHISANVNIVCTKWKTGTLCAIQYVYEQTVLKIIQTYSQNLQLLIISASLVLRRSIDNKYVPYNIIGYCLYYVSFGKHTTSTLKHWKYNDIITFAKLSNV